MVIDIIPLDFSSTTTISNKTMGSSSSFCYGESKAPDYSSNSLENIKIRPIYHRPIIDTFSWSDFPINVHKEEIIDDDEDDNNDNNDNNNNNNNNNNDNDNDNSFDNHYDCNGSIPMITASSYYCSLTSTTTTTTEKTKAVSNNVRFAPSLDVRTFSLILGDHPWCKDDLAIELGWEYNMEQVEDDDNQRTNSISYYSHMPTSSSPSRLSHLERKNLLIDVAGYTKEELELEMMTKRKNRNDKIKRPLQKSSKSITCLSLIPSHVVRQQQQQQQQQQFE
jgi:hypothetical protein